LAGLITLSFVVSACGSRLSGQQAALAEGAGFAHEESAGTSSPGDGAIGTTGTSPADAAGTASDIGPTDGSAEKSTEGAAGTTSAGVTHAGTAATTKNATPGVSAPGATSAGACGPDGNQTPAAGNGGATAVGVTATTINVGNIASISGVVPGLTQTAQQSTEAWAAYVNSTGGICGRQIKVQPFDDGSDSGTDFADVQQACSSDFAMVGGASAFDDGGAQAVTSCGIPDMAAIAITSAAGNTPDIFGASPGNAHYLPLGPAAYIHATYPTASEHAAIIYLNVTASVAEAANEVAAYKSAGFNYVYNESTTPTNANYAANVQAMQSAGAQYVTEISDADSAERLLQSMQEANFAPQVVDWDVEEYSPQFAQQTTPESNGDLVPMVVTAAYEDAASNPGMQLMESWLNRVAPGYHQDIYAILAWSAGLAFEQAAKAVGPDLTRAALISQLQQITNWTGDGLTPSVNIGQKIPSNCFFYMKIENGAYQRVYPSAPNTYDCNSGLYKY
jgi:ABC-type branched-subunit amino acid transport system substrate-binding protein